jgi:hypothetical protein
MHPINKYARVNRKIGCIVYCIHCSTYRRVIDISSLFLYCSKCRLFHPKQDYLTFSNSERIEFERQATILRSFYIKSLKSIIFKNRYRKEYNKKQVEDQYILSIPIPDNHDLMNFLRTSAKNIGCSEKDILLVAENIHSSVVCSSINESLIVELWVFPLFYLQHSIEVYEKSRRFQQ